MKTFIIPGHDPSTPGGMVVKDLCNLIKEGCENVILLPGMTEAAEILKSDKEEKIVLELKMSMSERSDVIFTYPTRTSPRIIDRMIDEILHRKLYFNVPVDQIRNFSYMLDLDCNYIRIEMYRLFIPEEKKFITSQRGMRLVSSYFIDLLNEWSR